MTTNQAWYIRYGGNVKGPYPTGLIGRFILLGRLKETDEVSADGQTWQRVQDVAQLIPAVLKADPADPFTKERIEAARRWADDRGPDRRVSGANVDDNRREASDRRTPEDHAFVRHRLARVARARLAGGGGGGKWGGILVGLTVLAMVAGVAFVYRSPVSNIRADCGAAPKPGVNWNQCAMEGAHLDGVDISGAKLNSAKLTGAQLRGAHIRGADLAYSDLSLADLQDADLRDASLLGANLRHSRLGRAVLQGANLSYANLTDAELSGVNIAGVILDHAIWMDGTVCGIGSRGECKK